MIVTAEEAANWTPSTSEVFGEYVKIIDALPSFTTRNLQIYLAKTPPIQPVGFAVRLLRKDPNPAAPVRPRPSYRHNLKVRLRAFEADAPGVGLQAQQRASWPKKTFLRYLQEDVYACPVEVIVLAVHVGEVRVANA
jgi:hypothetical protein